MIIESLGVCDAEILYFIFKLLNVWVLEKCEMTEFKICCEKYCLLILIDLPNWYTVFNFEIHMNLRT